MTHSELAGTYFAQGYNCAQSVLLAYREELGLTEENAAALASGFGGGFGRLREVCGAFSGAVAVLNMKCGYTSPTDRLAKAVHYARVQRMAADFRLATGTLICRELLDPSRATTSPVPDARTAEYYASRPCPALVKLGAQIVEDELKRSDPEIDPAELAK